MAFQIELTWGVVRGLLPERFSFSQIKNIIGASGLPVERLSHLQQKSSGGASKGQLMDGIDGLLNDLNPEEKVEFLKRCAQVMIERQPELDKHFQWLKSAENLRGIGNSAEEHRSRLTEKSVVIIDLVGYSTTAEALAQNLDQSAVTILNNQIQGFIKAGLAAAGVSLASALHKSMGDGAILYFDHPADAIRCAISIHKASSIHNASRTEKTAKRYFRIGIATGEVDITISPSGSDAAGTTIARAARFEPKAEAGGILIDEATFRGLTIDQKKGWGKKIFISGKHGETFEAYPILIDDACAKDLKRANHGGPDLDHKPELNDESYGTFTSCAHFFADRFSAAFPGLRDPISWFNQTEEIAKRLDRLLAKPLRSGDFWPIWWFRGMSNNNVTTFARLDSRTWLFNNEELQIARIAAVYDPAYWNRFVYVEVSGVAPSPERDPLATARMLKSRGYASEEFCLFRGQYLRRVFFDDGAAEIDGHLVDFKGETELRVKYVTSYNLLIAAQDCPINNIEFDKRLEVLMNGILSNSVTLEDLVHEAHALPRKANFFPGD